MNNNSIRIALAAVGDRLRLDRDVEILIVGGAAGVLTGELPAAWTTADVDVLHFRLPQDRDEVLRAAESAAKDLSLPANWLSEDVGLYAWTLPDKWQKRKVFIASRGHLKVHAAGRLDLIAMKFVAHRERDLEHLAQLNVTPKDRVFVSDYLDSMAKQYPAEMGRIELARQYLLAWAEKA